MLQWAYKGVLNVGFAPVTLRVPDVTVETKPSAQVGIFCGYSLDTLDSQVQFLL